MDNDSFATPYRITRTWHGSIHTHLAVFYPLLQTRARIGGEKPSQRKVETLTEVVIGDYGV